MDFQSLPMVQDVIESSQIVEYPCFTAMPQLDETVLEFRIDKTDAYLDLSQTFINLKVQILKADGTKLGAKDFVAPVNNSFYSFFQNVELYINDNKLTATDTNYPHWNYLKTLFFINPLEKKTFLAGVCWYPDESGKFDVITKPTEKAQVTNSGFDFRREVFADSQVTNLFGRLSLNVMFDRLIPAQTEILIRMHRKPLSFSLMAEKGKSFKMKILDAKIYATRVR